MNIVARWILAEFHSKPVMDFFEIDKRVSQEHSLSIGIPDNSLEQLIELGLVFKFKPKRPQDYQLTDYALTNKGGKVCDELFGQHGRNRNPLSRLREEIKQGLYISDPIPSQS